MGISGGFALFKQVFRRWLLIYQIDDEIEEVYFVRTGTHSDLY